MRLPNAERAIIRPEKLRDYLLSPTHPMNRRKWAFFSSLGYTVSTWRALERALREEHLALDVSEEKLTDWGVLYILAGPLTGRAGQRAVVRSVWIVRHGEERPRFVTAYPANE